MIPPSAQKHFRPRNVPITLLSFFYPQGLLSSHACPPALALTFGGRFFSNLLSFSSLLFSGQFDSSAFSSVVETPPFFLRSPHPSFAFLGRDRTFTSQSRSLHAEVFSKQWFFFRRPSPKGLFWWYGGFSFLLFYFTLFLLPTLVIFFSRAAFSSLICNFPSPTEKGCLRASGSVVGLYLPPLFFS